MSTTGRVCVWVLALGAVSTGAQAQVNGGPGEDTETAVLVADAARRLELAESILAAREAQTGRALDPKYRAFLKADLSSATAGQLEAAAADPAANLHELMTPGDTSVDLVYTPVPPCRIIDTRSATAGILVANTQRNFVVAGGAGFTAQGGNPTGCGVPFGPATSAMINFAAVNPAGSGNLRAWAVAVPQPPAPNAVVINYHAILSSLDNAIAVPICDPAAGSCISDVRLQADASSVQVVADVVGYFSRVSAPRTTQILYNLQTDAAPPGAVAPVSFRTLGTFTKAVTASEIEVTWHGHVRQTGTPGSTFCQYQLRVDDTLPTGVTIATGVGAVVYGADSSATLSGRWSGLATGSHTVSLWLRGTATICTLNAGAFTQQQVFVVER